MNRLVLSLALVALSAIGAQAQNYPTRSGTVIVPFAAGGPADITGRIVADIFSRHLGQQFVVENAAGAGGTTGTTRAARANPDGYTVDLRPSRHQRAGGHLLSQPRLRRRKGLRADRADRRAARAAGDPQGSPAQQPQGVRRLRQGQREQAQHGACRRRLGVLHRLPAAQLRHRHQADHGAVHRHRARRQRDARRPGRLRLRSDPRARCRMCAPARSRRWRSPPRSAARCCRTCRPPPSRACRSSTWRRSMRCSRPRARRKPSSTSSPTRSARGSTRSRSASGWRASAPTIAEPTRRGPKALGELVHSEIARLTPILKAAAAK